MHTRQTARGRQRKDEGTSLSRKGRVATGRTEQRKRARQAVSRGHEREDKRREGVTAERKERTGGETEEEREDRIRQETRGERR
jgi:hypothetical protein